MKCSHLYRSPHESSPNLLASSFSNVFRRYILKHGHITHENKPIPIWIIFRISSWVTYGFGRDNSFYVAPHKHYSKSSDCLTTCLCGHLEWWGCLNMYKFTHEIGQLQYTGYPTKFHNEWPIVSGETWVCNGEPHKRCSRSSDVPNNMFV